MEVKSNCSKSKCHIFKNSQYFPSESNQYEMLICVYENRGTLADINSLDLLNFISNYLQNMQNDQSNLLPEVESKKSDTFTVPELTNEELYNKILTDLKENLQKCLNAYSPCKIKGFVGKLFRSNCSNLTDIQLQCIVLQIQTFFKDHKTIEAQMSSIRYYHEMIILVERFRTYISSVMPLMFVQTMGNVKGEDKFYYVKELKAIYRIWHGYMDMQFLRKIRDFCTASYRINLLDLDMTDKYLSKEFKGIKYNKYTAQKIFNGNYNGFSQQNFNYQPKPFFRQKFNHNKKKESNNHEKDETLSNQTNNVSELKEKTQASLDDLNELKEIDHNNQSIANEKAIEAKEPEKKQDSNQRKENHKLLQSIAPKKQEKTLQKPSIPVVQKDKAQMIKKAQEANADKQAKANKLKQMYALMMMSKKRRVGWKFLVSSGEWQICEDIIQVLKDKTFKKEINQLIDKEIEQEDEEWIYPENKIDHSRESNQPFQFACKFCGNNFQVLVQNKEEYFKDIVCFEMRKGEKKFSKSVPCFHIKSQDDCSQGLFLLHRECFDVVRKGEVDEKKWELK